MAFLNFLSNLSGAIPGMDQLANSSPGFAGGMFPNDAQTIQGMGGLEQSLAQNQALGQQRQQMMPEKRKIGIMDILGALGDAARGWKGQEAVYGPMMEQRRQKQKAEEQRQHMGEAIGNYLGNTDGALGEIMRSDPETGVALWKMTHPQEKSADTPSAVREYEFYSQLPPDKQALYRRFRQISRPQIIGSPAAGYSVYDPEGGEGGASSGPPPGAIEHLRANPSLAPAFDEKYGEGAAASVLGGAMASPSPNFP